jgi:hypothetical protein
VFYLLCARDFSLPWGSGGHTPLNYQLSKRFKT